jgi:hypothetical protein
MNIFLYIYAVFFIRGRHMPFYQKIDPKTESGKRTLERLLLLRETLKQEIPERTQKETLLLATWNIRGSLTARNLKKEWMKQSTT